MATHADMNIMDFDEDDGLKHGHGKKQTKSQNPILSFKIFLL